MRSDIEWKYWGRTDPLWAVATWRGKQADGPSRWDPGEFLQLGQSDFADVFRHWTHYGLVSGRCVEIGCGAGRMTSQLAGVFASVLALDVSPDQIEQARKLLGTAADKVEFRVVSEPKIPAPDASQDAMFSCHVFQHFSDARGIRAYLEDTRRVLRSGGTVCFHLPVPGAHRSSQSFAWLWLRNLAKKGLRLLGARRLMEYHRYPVLTVLRMLQDLGYQEAELRLFAMHSNGDFHSFFFARKP